MPHCTLLSEYKNKNTKVNVKCHCGCEWSSYPDVLLNSKIGCPNCRSIFQGDSRRKNLDEVKRELLVANNNIELIGDYISGHKEAKFRCKRIDCGYEFYTSPNNVINSGGDCPLCGKNISMSTVDFKELLRRKNENIQLIGEYSSLKNNVTCKCLIDGYEWTQNARTLLDNPKCNVCTNGKINSKEMYLIKLQQLVVTDVEPLEEYVDATTKIKHMCKICNSEFLISPKHVLRGQIHRKCALKRNGEKRKFNLDELKSTVIELTNGEYEIIDDSYINNSQKINFIHHHHNYDHTFKMTVNSFLNAKQRCPVCKGLQVQKGFNDINTTNPSVARLMLNEEDRYNHTEFSGVKVDFKCDTCGEIINSAIKDISIRGLSCPICSDGISYPCKFAYNMIKQLFDVGEVDYIDREIKFKWANFIYDGKNRYAVYDVEFHKNNKKYIIEMDGGFHYKSYKNKSLEESKDIDEIKDKLARSNGYEIIRINCDYSSNDRFNYICNNILASKLNEILELSLVDFNKIDVESQVSLLKFACDLWNEGHSCKYITKKVGVHQSTVTSYLKHGAKLKLCDYTKETSRIRGSGQKVICNETKDVFNTIVEASAITGINVTAISRSCRGVHTYKGFYNGIKVTWSYYEEAN